MGMSAWTRRVLAEEESPKESLGGEQRIQRKNQTANGAEDHHVSTASAHKERS